MNSPIITVITPVYNSPDVLDTVKSIASQDYTNIQYIVIDDGSKHFDPNSIKKTAMAINPNIELIIMENEFNIGTVRTLNRAIMNSNGKYIFSIAADDILHDDHVISDWVNEFESTGSMVVMGLRDVYDSQMRVCLRTDPSKKMRKKIQSASPDKLFEMMSVCNLVIGCSTAQSRESFDRYGLYDETYKYIEDYPRYLLLSRKGVKVHLFNRVVVNYRMGGISSQSQFNDTYEKENDLIYSKEIYPYATNKETADKNYSKWKKRIKMKAAFIQKYVNSDGKLSRFSAIVQYFIRDPLWAGQLYMDSIKTKMRH